MRVISGSARGTVLHSIEDISTRPTLDRVKESLFNIIQNDIEDTTVLDLFAGSGAIGIEFLSRRAKQVYFCDKSSKAVAMIEKNLEKTKLKEKAIVWLSQIARGINEILKYTHTGIKEYQKIEQLGKSRQIQLKL